MRVQHNITAMNSYRNFTANNSQLGKNLEKLSSGYSINRAGDNAAGLAISEKMRAQITGLEVAQKNANDGISLVQTAEGALTEVHSMLNRMYELADQSANGTYENSVDRKQLQKEVDALKEEINRIADSANFNGIQLLDGSLSTTGVDANLSTNVSTEKTSQTSNTYKTTAFAGATATLVAAEGDKVSYTVAWKDENGSEFSKTVNLTAAKGKTLNTETGSNAYTEGYIYLQADDGTVYTPSTYVDGSTEDHTTFALNDVKKAVETELKKDATLSASFDIKFTGATGNNYTLDTLQFTAKTSGSSGAEITSMGLKQTAKDGTAIQKFFNTSSADPTIATNVTTYKGKDVMQKIDLTGVAVLKGAETTASNYTDTMLAKATFEIDGNKFVMVGNGATSAGLTALTEALGDDINIINLGKDSAIVGHDTIPTNSDAAFSTTDAKTSAVVAQELSRITGMDFSAAAANGGTDGNNIADGITAKEIYYSGDVELSNVSTLKEGSLVLQIGDTSDSFNQMKVEVADTHTGSLGIKDDYGNITSSLADVDISTQEGAAAACDVLKAAINQISDVRGGLGAIQNRLEHTINNLGVMQENLQNAESVIRDTDVASQMMEYTKNSILNQSAQAMLAQANQLPQGVLQLLQ